MISHLSVPHADVLFFFFFLPPSLVFSPQIQFIIDSPLQIKLSDLYRSALLSLPLLSLLPLCWSVSQQSSPQTRFIVRLQPPSLGGPRVLWSQPSRQPSKLLGPHTLLRLRHLQTPFTPTIDLVHFVTHFIPRPFSLDIPTSSDFRSISSNSTAQIPERDRLSPLSTHQRPSYAETACKFASRRPTLSSPHSRSFPILPTARRRIR